MQTRAERDGYSHLSIALHWLAAIAVIALFLSHEGGRGSATYAFHVGGGAILGVLLLWRVAHRLMRGMATEPDQPAALNLLSRLVLWGFLAAMVVAVVSGYVLPWSVGQPIDVFGVISLPPPFAMPHAVHEIAEVAHKVSGDAFVPLLALHVLGVLKHAVIDRDGVARRIVKAVPGGR
ncbi:MAG: cytochrome b/b6 domain-containing protein [Hyphomicrobiaceae bacterium]